MSSILHTTTNTRKVTSDYKILRSDAITVNDEQDIQFLKDHEVDLILDFRSSFETQKMPDALLDDPYFTYINFPILEGNLLPTSADAFSALYIVIAEDEQMGEIFKMIANAPHGVLYHCTAGKDRTGVVSAILYLLAGKSRDFIMKDYMLTKEASELLYEKIIVKSPNLDKSMVIPQEEYMNEFLRAFFEKYDSAEDYLKKKGLTEEEIDKLRNKMLNQEEMMTKMTLQEFELEFEKLGTNYKTKDVDRFCKKLIKEKIDVSFLKEIIPEKQQYYTTYYQVSIALCDTLDEKFAFIEENQELMHDWWHTDCIMKYLGNDLTFDYAYEKAKDYVKSDLPYTRRLGYVIFIPRLTKNPENISKLWGLLKNDEAYHVIMGEAWLISFLAMCDAEQTYNYLKDCNLDYAIIGKAIQKICDSYVVSKEDKEKFKSLRALKKGKKS